MRFRRESLSACAGYGPACEPRIKPAPSTFPDAPDEAWPEGGQNRCGPGCRVAVALRKETERAAGYRATHTDGTVSVSSWMGIIRCL